MLTPSGQTPAETAAPVRTCDIVIRNGYVLSMDSRRTVYPSGAVAIDGDRIVAVGPERDVLGRFSGRRVFDAKGAPVHPGMLDLHFHTICHTTRSVFPDHLPKQEYSLLYDKWYDAADSEDEYAAALLASVELALNGSTFFMEPGTAFDPDAVAAAAQEVGIRASVADPWLWDNKNDPRAPVALPRAPADTERCLRLLGGQLYRNADPAALVRGHVTIFGGGTATEELTRAASGIAERNGAIFNQHQSFTRSSAEFDDARFGRHPLVHLAEMGVLGPHCTFSHMNVLRDDEIEPIVHSGMSIVWCAAVSMNWHIGSMTTRRHPELHALGVNISSGTDVPRYGVGEQGLISHLLARDIGSYQIGPEEALEMATVNGARSAGLSEVVGSLEPGKFADVVIRTNELSEAHAGWDVVRSLMFATRTKSVRTVIVAGKVIVDGGHLTTVDERTAYEKAHVSVTRLMGRIGITPSLRWPSVS